MGFSPHLLWSKVGWTKKLDFEEKKTTCLVGIDIKITENTRFKFLLFSLSFAFFMYLIKSKVNIRYPCIEFSIKRHFLKFQYFWGYSLGLYFWGY